MRLAVEALWPELVYKLPPKKDCLMGVPEGCGAIGNSLRRERQMEIYALYRDRKQLCTFFGPRRTSAGQMALFFSPASAGLFFGSSSRGVTQRNVFR
jgi:hypothetical protein